MLDTAINEYRHLSIPSSNVINATTGQNQTTRPQSHVIQVAGYAVSFSELVQRFGARIDNGFNSPADFADAVSAPENDYESEKQVFVPRDSNNDRYDAHEFGQNRDSRRDSSTSIAYNNDNREAANSDDTGSGQRSNQGYEHRNSENHESSHTDKNNSNGNHESRESINDSANATNSNNRLDAVGIKGTDGENANIDNNTLLGQTTDVTNQHLIGNEVASTLTAALFGYNKIIAHQDKLQNFSQGKSSTELLTSTPNNSGRSLLDSQGKNSSELLSSTTNNSGRSPLTSSIHTSQQTAQTALQANSMQQNKDGAIYQPQPMDNLQRQAIQLSQAIGGNYRSKVEINVSNDLTSFTSRPTSSMANASIFTQESGSNNQTNQSGQHQSNANLAATINAQAQNVGQQNTTNQATFRQQSVQAFTQGRADGQNVGPLNQLATSGAGSQASNDVSSTSNQSATASNQQTQQASGNRELAQSQSTQNQRTPLQNQNIAEQISIKIQWAIQAGNDRINIQLKPAELGKVDVTMELTHDGRIQAIVTAENKDTLDLLRQDASELQRALRDAGLKTGNGDLSFSLRGEQEKQAEENSDNPSTSKNEEEGEGTDVNDTLPDEGVMAAWEAGVLSNSRLDVRV